MFESLSDRLQAVFARLRGHGKLTEKDVDEALREVRLALLEADVNFKVVKGFIAKIREQAVGSEVLESLTPDQHVVKIVHDELIEMLGGMDTKSALNLSGAAPVVIMMVGLQGSGKTTTTAKLALQLRKAGHRPLMVAADVYRPAAITQLQTLGKQLDIPVYHEPPGSKPPDICANAVRQAKAGANSVVILDTAGRLHIDEVMMEEVAEVRRRVNPNEVLLVADAMTGQEAVRVAGEFHEKVGLTGLVLTKVDGDARGGAALSIRAVTGVPIKYIGMGEKADALEPFYADRLASRILGMGDVLTLIEKAQENYDEKSAAVMQQKIRRATFDLDDFLKQIQQLKKMGPLQQLVEMIPGMGKMARSKEFTDAFDEKQVKRIEAIISSMTMDERQEPTMIDGSRRRRIAKGSGTTAQEVNQLLNQFQDARKMMKQIAKGKMPGIPGLFG